MPRFDEKKTTQAAARFLDLAGGRLNYMVLIKLLYMLDRHALLNWGRPVTSDEYFSMKHGPVLSQVHDLITEMTEEPTYWSTYISDPSHYEVSLIKDPGDGELSEVESELIPQVFATFGQFKPFELVHRLHDIL